jgi:hypothetical protein
MNKLFYGRCDTNRRAKFNYAMANPDKSGSKLDFLFICYMLIRLRMGFKKIRNHSNFLISRDAARFIFGTRIKQPPDQSLITEIFTYGQKMASACQTKTFRFRTFSRDKLRRLNGPRTQHGQVKKATLRKNVANPKRIIIITIVVIITAFRSLKLKKKSRRSLKEHNCQVNVTSTALDEHRILQNFRKIN